MKKILIAALFLLAFSTPKEYKLTEGQATMLFNALETAKKTIPTSQSISALEANNSLIAIDSIQKVIYRQYVDSTKKK